MINSVDKVKLAMLATQRYPWEQGVCAQAIYESGDVNTAIAMAHDAVLRQKPDGRLAVISDNIAVTDPAALDVMLTYQCTDGRFHDILDDETSFVEGTAAMMMATFIYRGHVNGWIEEEYLAKADLVATTMEKYIDDYGIIQEVCGCPDFVSVGTSAESMAAYIMMHSWESKVKRQSSY